MRSVLRHLFVFLMLLVCAIPAFAQDVLVIEGTGDSQKLLRDLATAFEAANPGTRIVVPDSIGSSGGIKSLVKGNCGMARVARPPKDKEKALASDLSYREFAYSPVVFVANLPEKCVDNLTTGQIIALFSGAIDNWSKLGSCGENKIFVAMREAGDSSRSVLEKLIPGFRDIPEFAGRVIYSTPEAVQTLEEYPFTVGFLPQAQTSPRLVTFSVNGIAPGESSVQDGSYPLFSPFGLVWRGELAGLGARFVDFIFSSEGTGLLRAAGVIPVSGR